VTDDYDLPMEAYRRAGLEITKGTPELYKSLWSRRDDVTLANPFGPPVRGWEEVSPLYEAHRDRRLRPAPHAPGRSASSLRVRKRPQQEMILQVGSPTGR
jgi:hypothetical protein